MDLQRRLSLHPNIVRFLGACCHLPDGPIDASALYSGTSVSTKIGAKYKVGSQNKVKYGYPASTLLRPTQGPPYLPGSKKLRPILGASIFIRVKGTVAN